MSEQQSLIPNLKEIMEESAGSEEEATLKLQTTIHEQEMPEEIIETKAPTKEGGKRREIRRKKKNKKMRMRCMS